MITKLAIVVTVLLLSAARGTEAQPAPKVPRVGVLCIAACSSPLILAFEAGLRELGWMEGRNVILERRPADNRLDRLPEVAAELVRLRPDVILVSSPPTVAAAMQATPTIPIVFFAVADPVGSKFVASLRQPGGNVTGLASAVPEGAEGKLLELATQVVPGARRVAILVNPSNPLHYGRAPAVPRVPSKPTHLSVMTS